MLKSVPVPIMSCDLRTFTIDYVNAASLDALKAIEHALPCRAENIIGQPIDVFHKHPEHQRKLLSDPQNLPIRRGSHWVMKYWSLT